ncbi:MAG: YybH family protein [Gemmatimonadales bacterium]
MLLRLVFGLALALLTASCASSNDLSPAEAAAVRQTLESYRQAWLRNDENAVMAHVSDDVTLYLPGPTTPPVRGGPALRSFWFPTGGAGFRITKYEIMGETIHGNGSFAVAEGISLLAWETLAGDSVVESATSRTEYLTVLRREGDQWRLFRQMYLPRD